MNRNGLGSVDAATQRRIDKATRARSGTVTCSEERVALFCESENGETMICYWVPKNARAIAYAILEAADRVEGKEPARA